jgi:hypothetical protein
MTDGTCHMKNRRQAEFVVISVVSSKLTRAAYSLSHFLIMQFIVDIEYNADTAIHPEAHTYKQYKVAALLFNFPTNHSRRSSCNLQAMKFQDFKIEAISLPSLSRFFFQ